MDGNKVAGERSQFCIGKKSQVKKSRKQLSSQTTQRPCDDWTCAHRLIYYHSAPVLIVANWAAGQHINENWTLAYAMCISVTKSSDTNSSNCRNYFQNVTTYRILRCNFLI